MTYHTLDESIPAAAVLAVVLAAAATQGKAAWSLIGVSVLLLLLLAALPSAVAEFRCGHHTRATLVIQSLCGMAAGVAGAWLFHVRQLPWAAAGGLVLGLLFVPALLLALFAVTDPDANPP